MGCVQWLKDGVPIATPQTTSTLIGPEEGRYVPVLTVNDHENAAGTYVCNISNNKPDAVSDSVDVHGEMIVNSITITVTSCIQIEPPNTSFYSVNSKGQHKLYQISSHILLLCMYTDIASYDPDITIVNYCCCDFYVINITCSCTNLFKCLHRTDWAHFHNGRARSKLRQMSKL